MKIPVFIIIVFCFCFVQAQMPKDTLLEQANYISFVKYKHIKKYDKNIYRNQNIFAIISIYPIKIGNRHD